MGFHGDQLCPSYQGSERRGTAAAIAFSHDGVVVVRRGQLIDVECSRSEDASWINLYRLGIGALLGTTKRNRRIVVQVDQLVKRKAMA